MTKRPIEDMHPRSKSCPHCGDQLHGCRFAHLESTQKRCPNCRCRWRLDGKHVVAGRYCPLQLTLPVGA